MNETENFEKSVNLGKYLAYDDIISKVTDLKVKYHKESLEGSRSWNETVEITNALDLLSSIARCKSNEALKQC